MLYDLFVFGMGFLAARCLPRPMTWSNLKRYFLLQKTDNK